MSERVSSSFIAELEARIESQKAENAKLREALDKILDYAMDGSTFPIEGIARAALSADKAEEREMPNPTREEIAEILEPLLKNPPF